MQPAKDLSSIKIREAMNGAERKEGIENQAHPSGPDKLYGKWAVKRRAKQASLSVAGCVVKPKFRNSNQREKC